MILYRGDTRRKAPDLKAGTWLTPDADVAAWYGCAHRYEVADDLNILDLTALGVGDGEDDDQVRALEDALREAGIDPTSVPTGLAEIYMVVESRQLQHVARKAGYDAIACMQWHADMSSRPYEAVLILEDTG